MLNSSQKNGFMETQKKIFYVKERFEKYLSKKLNLQKVMAPLFVEKNSGIQDNLNGIERPVSFKVRAFDNIEYEIVQSLAKWKRFALKKYKIPVGKGIFTEMKALRPDEANFETGIHSIYVDQWDWEKRIEHKDRNLRTLKATVKSIYRAIKEVERDLYEKFNIKPILPEEITFIHSEDAFFLFSNLSPKEREDKLSEMYGAIFLIGIGGKLPDGSIHDGRAPDYDDWSTPTPEGKKGLNGDIIFWNPVLKRGFEISSMGIRVDKDTLIKQLKIRKATERLELPWHRMLLNGELPESIGGGIGQSRLSMFLLRKKHIGEVQASFWPKKIIESRLKEGVMFL